ncbi:hypothetical protein NCC49_000679 [Naganishia albida]|nr:hypothetical protein NCC49_000679 [Naganishia albida]
MPARDTTFGDPTITATGQIRIFRDNHARRSISSNLYYYIRLKNNKRNGQIKGQSDRVGVNDSRMQLCVPQDSIDHMMDLYGNKGIMHDEETTTLFTHPDPRYRSIAFVLELAKIKFYNGEWTMERGQAFANFWCSKERAFYQFSKLVPDPELAAALPAALNLVPQVPSVATISRQALSGNNIGRIVIRCPNVNVLEIIKSDGPSMIRVNGELYDMGDDEEEEEEEE